MIPKNFRDKHHQRMAEEDSVTYLPGGQQSKVPPHQQPSYQVITVQLRGKDDFPIMLSGNELTLPVQLSILKAVDMLAEIRGWGKGGTQSANDRDIVKRRGQPKVKLFFMEDIETIPLHQSPVTGECTFRLMNVSDDPESDKPKITESDIKRLAQNIKSIFFSPTPYTWKKGRQMVTYSEWNLGYQLQIRCNSKAAGIELTKKILSIQNHPYQPKLLNHKVVEDEEGAYPTVPPEVTVLGKKVKAPRSLPIAEVNFIQATLSLHYWPKDIVLVNDIGDILPDFPNL